MAANRGSSSKAPRFIRHRRRFGAFPLGRGGSDCAAPKSLPCVRGGGAKRRRGCPLTGCPKGARGLSPTGNFLSPAKESHQRTPFETPWFQNFLARAACKEMTECSATRSARPIFPWRKCGIVLSFYFRCRPALNCRRAAFYAFRRDLHPPPPPKAPSDEGAVSEAD